MSMETFKHLFENNDQLIKEKNLHTFLGISKTDAQTITQRYPDIPHVTLNGNNYFPKSQLREWVKKIG
ncbi:MAG: hypothetical protein LRY73_18900 [Bacillus sp. (in: Bacteria)]|nr:hypothetical protein [Bacillus sp. (in: firmicutes)]